MLKGIARFFRAVRREIHFIFYGMGYAVLVLPFLLVFRTIGAIIGALRRAVQYVRKRGASGTLDEVGRKIAAVLVAMVVQIGQWIGSLITIIGLVPMVFVLSVARQFGASPLEWLLGKMGNSGLITALLDMIKRLNGACKKSESSLSKYVDRALELLGVRRIGAWIERVLVALLNFLARTWPARFVVFLFGLLETVFVTILHACTQMLMGRDRAGKNDRADERELITMEALCMGRDMAVVASVFDLSDQGMKIRFPKKLHKGEFIKLRIQPQASGSAKAELITMMMEVRWCKSRAADSDFNVGLRFCGDQDSDVVSWKQEQLKNLRKRARVDSTKKATAAARPPAHA